MLARCGNRLSKKSFRALDDRGGVSTNTTCGTHIHLSPRSARWSLEDLKKLSCCILYFERAFEVLYPEARIPPEILHMVERVAPWQEGYTKESAAWRESYTEETRKNKPSYLPSQSITVVSPVLSSYYSSRLVPKPNRSPVL